VLTALGEEEWSLATGEWIDEFEPRDEGCRVIERWADLPPKWLVVIPAGVNGVSGRRGLNSAGMGAALADLSDTADQHLARSR